MSDTTDQGLLDATIDYIREQLQAQQITIPDLSNLTGIPKDTINNIIYHRTKNPGYEVVAQMVYSLGGSVDEIAGYPRVLIPAGVTGDAAQYLPHITRGWIQAQINLLAMSRQERRAKTTWMIVALVIIAFILVILAVDASNGAIGFIRYQVAAGHWQSALRGVFG